MERMQLQTTKVRLERPGTGHKPMRGEVESNNYHAMKELMFEYQKYTEASHLILVDDVTNEKIAEMTFEYEDG